MASPSLVMERAMAQDRSPKIVVGSVVVGAAAAVAVVLRMISHRIIRSAYDWSDFLILVGLASVIDASDHRPLLRATSSSCPSGFAQPRLSVSLFKA